MLLPEIVSYAARKAPDAPALYFEDEVVTFGQLDRQVRRLANALLSIAKAGDRIAVLSENRAEYIDLYYGVPAAKMGLTFLNYRLNPKELAKITADAGATVLFTEAKYLDTAASIVEAAPTVTSVVVMGGDPSGRWLEYDDVIGAASSAPPEIAVDEDDLAWLIYTSGTTGSPKGAMLSHRNLITATLNATTNSTPEDDTVTLFPWPLCHVAGYVFPICHLMRSPVALMRAYEPESFFAHIQRHRVTNASMAPTMMNMLL